MDPKRRQRAKPAPRRSVPSPKLGARARKVHVLIRADDLRRLARLARTQGSSTSDLVREAVRRFLNKEDWRNDPLTKLIGAFSTGDPKASATIDDVLYGPDLSKTHGVNSHRRKTAQG